MRPAYPQQAQVYDMCSMSYFSFILEDLMLIYSQKGVDMLIICAYATSIQFLSDVSRQSFAVGRGADQNHVKL